MVFIEFQPVVTKIYKCFESVGHVATKFFYMFYLDMKIFSLNPYISNNKSSSQKQNGVFKKPSFQGVTKIMKRQIFIDGQKDIEEIFSRKKTKNFTVGQLPGFIFKKLPLEGRPEKIKEILTAFDDVAVIIRDFLPDGKCSIDEIKNSRPKIVNQILTDIMRKNKIISNFDDINLSYIDKGGKGSVYKIEGLYDHKNEDEFIIKIYHKIKGESWQPYKSHGNYAELNSAQYWIDKEGQDTQLGKFFFGNFQAGYQVNKFIDEDVRLPKRVVDEYSHGIKCTDEDKNFKGPTIGYNRLKGYNYDWGGKRVVNRIKNSDKVASYYLQKIKDTKPSERIHYWFSNFKATTPNMESKRAGLALGIKYFDNKNIYIDKCLELNSNYVNRALAYVLKYLPYDDALKYFEKLVKTEDNITQIILFNEIPLLSKIKDPGIPIKDDINASLKNIIPEKIYDYYLISEKYAKPETIEHLASFLHLLPEGKINEQYKKLSSIKNYALQERLLYKFSLLPNSHREFAMKQLKKNITNPELLEKLNNTTF